MLKYLLDKIIHLDVAPTSRPTRPPGACSRDEATCQNGECIPWEYACDGDFDCTDRSDELNCGMYEHQSLALNFLIINSRDYVVINLFFHIYYAAN